MGGAALHIEGHVRLCPHQQIQAEIASVLLSSGSDWGELLPTGRRAGRVRHVSSGWIKAPPPQKRKI